MKTYTINLVGLHDRKCVVIGGGHVALRKVEGLLEADAQVIVISPDLVPDLQQLVDEGRVNHHQRPYREGDLEDAFLVIAATSDVSTNRAVWSEAQGRGILVNAVDDPGHCNFFLPAVLHRGELSVAVSTGGNSPALARRMRERLEDFIEPEYGMLTDIMAELRSEILESFPPGKARLEAALSIIESDILKIIQNHGKEAAVRYARKQVQARL